MQYKAAKTAFRALLRKHQEQRDACYNELDLECGDPSKLFRLIRRANGIASEPTSVLNVGGITYKGEELPDAWASNFEDLASPSDHNFNDTFQLHICEQYTLINELPLDDFSLFTDEEVAEAISSLKLNKAAGLDGIDPEHLRYAGSLLPATLTLLFNAIVLSGHIPHVFRNGLVTPIPKGHTKDLTNPSNYRGITVLSNISKALEKLILVRISQLDPPPVLNPLQGGFHTDHSCSHSAFVLQEAIQSLRDAGKKAYVAM